MRPMVAALLLAALLAPFAAIADDDPIKRCKNHYILGPHGCVADTPAYAKGSYWEDQFAGLWWNPRQSGWGVSIQQQGQSMSATLLIYGKDGRPKVFHAPAVVLPVYDESDPYLLWDPITFTGALYDGIAGDARKVGSITFDMEGDLDGLGVVSYVIDGLWFNAPIERSLLAARPFTGTFDGSRIIYGRCGEIQSPIATRVDIARTGANATIRIEDQAALCEVRGPYAETGWRDYVRGTATCTDKRDSVVRDYDFVAYDIRMDRQAVAFNYWTFGPAECQFSGRIMAARRGILDAATPPHDDASGLWASKAGWDVIAHHQGNTIFAILLAPDATGGTTWYAATSASYVSGNDEDFVQYRGDLWATSGTFYNSPYDPSRFQTKRVGTLELAVDAGGYPGASFEIDGVKTSARVDRVTASRDASLAGSYVGARTTTSRTPAVTYAGKWTIQQQSIEVRIVYTDPEHSCDVTGAFHWRGAIGEIDGTATCRGQSGPPSSGAFTARQVQLGAQGLSMRYCMPVDGQTACGVLAGLTQ